MYSFLYMKKNKILTEEFIRFLKLNNVKELRLQKYRYSLGKIDSLFGKDFTKANREDIENLVLQIEKSDMADWTKHDYRVIIKKFWNWIYNKHIEDLDDWTISPLVKWIKTRPPRTVKKMPDELITPKDVKLLLQHCNNLRERALISVLYESGARIGELISLKRRDVHFDDHGCILNLYGKTGQRKVRLVGSAPAISQWLEMEHPRKNDKDAYVFCNTYQNTEKNYRGCKLTHQSVYKILRNIKNRSGFKKDINPHLFRHSRASELSEFLTDAQRCDYFGWEQGSQVCRVYTHLQDTNRAILELNGLIEKNKDSNGQYTSIICPRCGFTNPYGVDHCGKCTLPLSDESILNYDKQKEIATLLPRVMSNTELEDLIGDILFKKLNELKLAK